ncbi:unnamed protein product [Linum tenue]|uniref:CD2 antigen cytoplasmic tail-binding protein 2 n=1 Tax=Linum tenue TaxID=586396 RepID=A0AAV0MQU6_9ROSI|nr:unnamed protein product [Linum tenue]
MDGKLPRSSRKRPRNDEFEDEESTKRSMQQKKVRFPKGKKVKPGDDSGTVPAAVGPERVGPQDNLADDADARLAATERAKRRNQITAELFDGEVNDVSAAEVTYEDNDSFVDDGVQMEPFNLDREREEGYFDAQGNFVEYVNENDFKDPWLDTAEVDTRYANSKVAEDNDESEAPEMSSDETGQIKRRIADLLEPGETVLQALRRLKGTSIGKKEKMSAETQLLFDQLTEDANKLLDSGEYDVYHDKQEIFEREAEGYEKLASARGKDTLINRGQADPYNTRTHMLSDVGTVGASSSIVSSADAGTSGLNGNGVEASDDGADAYDMFGDEDDNTTANTSAYTDAVATGSVANVTTTAAAWVIIMTQTLGYTALRHRGYGTPSMRKPAPMT